MVVPEEEDIRQLIENINSAPCSPEDNNQALASIVETLNNILIKITDCCDPDSSVCSAIALQPCCNYIGVFSSGSINVYDHQGDFVDAISKYIVWGSCDLEFGDLVMVDTDPSCIARITLDPCVAAIRNNCCSSVSGSSSGSSSVPASSSAPGSSSAPASSASSGSLCDCPPSLNVTAMMSVKYSFGGPFDGGGLLPVQETIVGVVDGIHTTYEGSFNSGYPMPNAISSEQGFACEIVCSDAGGHTGGGSYLIDGVPSGDSQLGSAAVSGSDDGCGSVECNPIWRVVAEETDLMFPVTGGKRPWMYTELSDRNYLPDVEEEDPCCDIIVNHCCPPLIKAVVDGTWNIYAMVFHDRIDGCGYDSSLDFSAPNTEIPIGSSLISSWWDIESPNEGNGDLRVQVNCSDGSITVSGRQFQNFAFPDPRLSWEATFSGTATFSSCDDFPITIEAQANIVRFNRNGTSSTSAYGTVEVVIDFES